MKENLTEIVFILDQSGSMGHLRDDTIGGYNTYVEDQKKEPGEAYLTTVLFDDCYIVLHDHIKIQDVPVLTEKYYRPGGCTALMDAIGRTITSVGRRLADTPEEERPAHVIFVITTDGYENASKEYTREKVKQMIEHQQSKYSWTFLFFGAGIDAYQEAESIGIGSVHTMSVTADKTGTDNLYKSVITASNAVRSSVTLDGLDWKVGDVGCSDGNGT